ncbi:hypothetical protein A2U01_0109515, partial [Trifolium medium]|nr:hypothetical protein [Trifolium medium]
MEQLDAAASAN